ncbi:MAG: YbjQ family protein [Candidatus Diapherotrites archaeon]|nr:YbjQ family protein [Candidatus Diapherotrites archaeon]
MIETTTDFVPGMKIARILGVVRGNTIRSRGVGGHFIAGLQGAFGGEITAYVVALNEARTEAYNRMLEDAGKLGADAVINIRFVTSEVMPGAAELLAYGTAVKLSK